MKKDRAFTLAEVLITLTIIGVIAVLTIPNLIQSYRKHQVEAGLKESYTILSNALTMAKAEYGSFQEMTDSCRSRETYAEKSNCFADNYLKPYLKYSKSCVYDDGNCTRKIYPIGIYIKNFDGSNGASTQSFANFMLNNGIWVGVQWWATPSPYFIVDVNGSKGPNQSGTDIFYFTLQKGDNAPEPTDGLRCGDHAYEPTEYIKSFWCKNSPVYDKSCSCPIMHNSWKIPDDYPVKKW